jgi:hypothetical protein
VDDGGGWSTDPCEVRNGWNVGDHSHCTVERRHDAHTHVNTALASANSVYTSKVEERRYRVMVNSCGRKT